MEAHPTGDLRVYVIWEAMLATDSRSAWDPQAISDERVTHYWDEDLLAGLWFAGHSREMGLREPPDVVWDTFFVFDESVRWTRRAPRPLASGFTVIDERERLRSALVGEL